MGDNFWEPLAEIYIADRESTDPDDYIYCLCSRIFIRNPEVYTVLASEDASEGEDADGDYVGEMLDLSKGSGVETQSIEKHDEEPVSCYCSASHTDNNYSTDEHDSVRDSAHWPTAHSLTQKLGLHQSDSGADLSEYHDQHEAKSIQNLVASYGKTFQTIETEVENSCENVDMLTEYKHVSGDKEPVVQNLSDSTAILNTEGHNKDLITQYDYNTYAYPYSVDYGSNKSAMDIAWDKFWAKHGEQLIWASWIGKYADYINPDYFQNNVRTTEDEKPQDAEINEVAIERYFEQNTCFPSQAHKNCELVRSNFAGIFNKSYSSDSELKPAAISSSNTSFSFEQVSRQEINDKDADENRKKILNFEISPEDGDGWNPLSPLSIEENYNHPSNAEDERLLMRCDSVNGSITKTNATSDSMTNVTKMTLTSSSCDSNSVHSSSLVTSVTSSIESSMTSSSDQENEFSVEDNDKYWQQLWKENFETQYQKQYELFIENYKKEHNIDYNQLYFNTLNEPCDDSLNEPRDSIILQQNEEAAKLQYQEDKNEEFLKIDTCEDQRDESMDLVEIDLTTPSKVNSGNRNSRKNNTNSKSKLRTQRLIMDSVGMLMKNLTIKMEEDKPTDVVKEEEMHEEQQQAQDSMVTETKMEIMASSSNFNNSHQQKSSDGGDEFHEEVQEIYGQSHEANCNDSEDGLETVKKAFSLMGYANFIENESQRKLQGEVVYRKRNIRRQSFQLMAEHKRKTKYKNTLDAETIIKYTKTNKYLSCNPASISAETDAQSNDKGSYAKAQAAFTSSSDDEDSVKMMQRKKRRKQFKRLNKILPREIANDYRLWKYYIKRFGLFSRYEDGIKLDRESWFSVTPEEIAKDIAERCRCDTIIDAFCGAGSNTIQFAFTCERVIAIDIDPNKIKIARHNAGIYGVDDRIEFITGDFMQLAPQLVADVVFLSPPWGGPDYIKRKVFDLESIMPPVGGRRIFEAARRITQHVAYYLPRNSDPLQMIMLTDRYDKVEIQQNVFNGKLTACTAYYGELART
ncbi:PREDICTED: trimethylguanosine synthase [Wasmannia auropunctata]|uniref:trimethylguanosine synthase n=1 Tax=Wasmannia auropunctata TaxID=64793 RepID=UPI0005F0C406|nr:PREDICTED: trimethylguanosine synthase [Wasmannia auropunctata]